MLEHRAYCDESEDSHGRAIFAVCGYWGTTDAWRAFEILWKDALADRIVRIQARVARTRAGYRASKGPTPTR